MGQVILNIHSLVFVDPSHSMQIAFFGLGGLHDF